ncbi:hypothetical protein Scani_24640 [Streptomyces caniferus]|uniref:Uncharacterized protein n=1 Tax=Streptomyces caniferus TaxID=285557 RepID=A0A640S749_9ACTN|nr:hypothetical protein Scani_24640 [Streptomyces caniferus]
MDDLQAAARIALRSMGPRAAPPISGRPLLAYADSALAEELGSITPGDSGRATCAGAAAIRDCALAVPRGLGHGRLWIATSRINRAQPPHPPHRIEPPLQEHTVTDTRTAGPFIAAIDQGTTVKPMHPLRPGQSDRLHRPEGARADLPQAGLGGARRQ